MATIFNHDTVSGENLGGGASRQRLLTTARIPGTAILLDRLTLQADGQLALTVPSNSVAWLQVLDGNVTLTHGGDCQTLAVAHVAFLPPGFAGSLRTNDGATLLHGEIPDAARLDPRFAQDPPRFRVTDWTREPVLDSEHDARKRIYLVTPKLFGMKAIK